MLSKRNIIQKLRALKLPIDQYCVMTGAALVMHGIKESTADIDIGCTDALFVELLQRGHKLQQLKSYEGIIMDGDIEIFRNWQVEKKVYIDSLPVADIDCIRKYKEDLGREKDVEDIKLIDRYLEQKRN